MTAVVSESDYGAMVGASLRAVRLLHEDTSRLMLECDNIMRSRARKSLFRDDLWSQVKVSTRGASIWMPEAAVRGYVRNGEWDGWVTWVLAAFFDKSDESLREPLLVVARAKYRWRKKPPDLKVVGKWDLWSNRAEWSDMMTDLGSAYPVEDLPDDKIVGLTYVARRLCEVGRNELDQMVEAVDKRR
jgi:hypothetical protein